VPIKSLYNERELLLRVAAGDESAFTALFGQYWDHIYNVAFTLTKSRETARDIVQEIFIKVWLVREELPHKDNFPNFLFIVARNHILTELRKKIRETPFTDQLQAYFRESPLQADQQLLYHESQALIHQAVSALPDQQRQVYLLTRENGWSQDEIAQYLQVSKSTVKTHMSRALAAIREYLANNAHGLLLVIALFETFL
jgi:RNA polymerase sigma-70 factor (family 1)